MKMHIPVLINEVVDFLNPIDNATYLDCTFGAGGYSKRILDEADCNVVALDQDPNVSHFANALKKEFGNRFEFINNNFKNASNIFEHKFDGIVLDLGISSMQLAPERGFSFSKDGTLDMRMSCIGESAKDFIANVKEEDLANIIYKYSDEVRSRRIAKSIIDARSESPINTTFELADAIRKVANRAKIDSATKTFQAIRIHVNKELEALEVFLSSIRELLSLNGTIVIVSFHALEDRIVKRFFRENAVIKSKSKYHKEDFTDDGWLEIITKRPITASKTEIQSNPRSRSAKLRVAKMGGR